MDSVTFGMMSLEEAMNALFEIIAAFEETKPTLAEAFDNLMRIVNYEGSDEATEETTEEITACFRAVIPISCIFHCRITPWYTSGFE